MKLSEFKVGQRILFHGFAQRLMGYSNNPNSATVVKVTKIFIELHWDNRNPDRYKTTFRQQTTFDRITLLEDEDLVKDNQERVQRKIKRLWNTSNWVKKNPHLAY